LPDCVEDREYSFADCDEDGEYSFADCDEDGEYSLDCEEDGEYSLDCEEDGEYSLECEEEGEYSLEDWDEKRSFPDDWAEKRSLTDDCAEYESFPEDCADSFHATLGSICQGPMADIRLLEDPWCDPPLNAFWYSAYSIDRGEAANVVDWPLGQSFLSVYDCIFNAGTGTTVRTADFNGRMGPTGRSGRLSPVLIVRRPPSFSLGNWIFFGDLFLGVSGDASPDTCSRCCLCAR
jgi:hypothetical protein